MFRILGHVKNFVLYTDHFYGKSCLKVHYVTVCSYTFSHEVKMNNVLLLLITASES